LQQEEVMDKASNNDKSSRDRMKEKAGKSVHNGRPVEVMGEEPLDEDESD
jgi:hypothetical protein